MKKDLGTNPFLIPMPVLIISTYSENNIPDAMNAAWGTICGYDKVALFLSKGHKTVANIKNKKAFTVAIGDNAHLVQCDYVGLVSANDNIHKLAKTNFKISKSQNVDAPIIEDLPLTLECELDHIDENNGCIYGKIINIVVDEEVMTDGVVDFNKLNPISYDPCSRSYFVIGKKVGKAFDVGKVLK